MDCLRIVPCIVVLLISLSVSGCATGKSGEETSKEIVNKPVDSSYKSEGPEENTIDAKTAFAGEKKEVPDRKTLQPIASNRTTELKPPPELKPLWSVMHEKTHHKKKNKDQGPKIHVELAFDNADIHEVLDITLYELFRVNYMVDPSIKTNVTFHISGDYTKQQFINILNNVLQLNNLAIVNGPGDIYKVVQRASSAGSGNAPLAGDEPPDHAGDLTRMIRLRYIASASAAKNIKPFLSKNAVIVQDSVTNSLVITDTVENLDKAVSILGMMDIEYFADISWRVFPIEGADASEISRDLTRLLKTGGLYNRPGMDMGSFEIVPIKTMNALLVATKWPSMLTLIEDWITAMDHANDSGTNVFVYFVENGTAVELADILSQVYGGTAGSGPKKTTIVKPTAGTGLSGELSGEVEIIPDETNNAIVFRANGRDYKIIKEVLKKLDIVPRQVLINVVIAEVSLTGGLEYGVEWFLKDNAQSDYKLQGILHSGIDQLMDTDLGSGVTGFNLALLDSDDVLRGLISALDTEGEINILSSPNILAIDNKESIIEVGEQVPIPTGESMTDGGTTITSIQYRDTGVLLTVTPHINSSGLIKMELAQEVSEIGTEFKISEVTANSFLTRKAQTSLVIEDGQTIVIGGLMRSKSDKNSSGIPYLRDIPILGYLFGGMSDDFAKTELIFLVTPKVINTRAEADAITKDFSARVDLIKELIHKKEH